MSDGLPILRFLIYISRYINSISIIVSVGIRIIIVLGTFYVVIDRSTSGS